MMHTLLLVFEFLGTTELMVIALVALILFGPRKLPEIGRTVGKSIAEFKRASDDFKRTWEFEVELEQRKGALDAPAAAAVTNDADGAAYRAGLPGASDAGSSADEFAAGAARPDAAGETIARTPSSFEPDGWTAEPEVAAPHGDSAGHTWADAGADAKATPAANPAAGQVANTVPRGADKEDEINAS